MLRAQVIDAKLAAPRCSLFVTNASTARQRPVIATPGDKRLARRATTVQEPTQGEVIRVLRAGRAQLLCRNAGPLCRITLDVQERVNLLFRAETENAAFVDGEVASSTKRPLPLGSSPAASSGAQRSSSALL